MIWIRRHVELHRVDQLDPLIWCLNLFRCELGFGCDVTHGRIERLFRKRIREDAGWEVEPQFTDLHFGHIHLEIQVVEINQFEERGAIYDDFPHIDHTSGHRPARGSRDREILHHTLSFIKDGIGLVALAFQGHHLRFLSANTFPSQFGLTQLLFRLGQTGPGRHDVLLCHLPFHLGLIPLLQRRFIFGRQRLESLSVVPSFFLDLDSPIEQSSGARDLRIRPFNLKGYIQVEDS